MVMNLVLILIIIKVLNLWQKALLFSFLFSEKKSAVLNLMGWNSTQIPVNFVTNR